MRPATEPVGPASYDALRAAGEALLPPSAPADVRAWGDGVLAALTALVGGSRARLLLRVHGRAYAWGEAPAPAAEPPRARRGTVGLAVTAPDDAGGDAGEAAFVCVIPPDPDGAAADARLARASELLAAVRPALACAVALRARAARPPGPPDGPPLGAGPPGAGPLGDGRLGADPAESAAADRLRDRFALTVREREVVRLLLAGRRNREIARALGISPHTARHHTEHVLGKLGVDSRAAVAGLAARLAVAAPEPAAAAPRPRPG